MSESVNPPKPLEMSESLAAFHFVSANGILLALTGNRCN